MAKASKAEVAEGPERINPALAGLVRPLEGLRENPRNARIHGDRNLQAISASLSEFGQQAPLVALRDGMVLSGNGRLRVMLTLGWRRAAVMEFDSEDEARAAAYALKGLRDKSRNSWMNKRRNLRGIANLSCSSLPVGFMDNPDGGLTIRVSARLRPVWLKLLEAEVLLKEGRYGNAVRIALESFALFAEVHKTTWRDRTLGDIGFCLVYILRWQKFERFLECPLTLHRFHPAIRKLAKNLLVEQEGCCRYCGGELAGGFHVDHVVPRIQGGDDSESNLVLACPRCNISKGGRTPKQWLVALGAKKDTESCSS